MSDDQTHLAWDFYGKICRVIWRSLRSRWAEHPTFARELFLDGQFDPNLVHDFVQEALKSEQIPFDPEDSAKGYYSNQSSVLPLVETYNNIFVFRCLSPAAMEILGQCISSIASEVTECLGSNWRVVQTRYWETKSGGEGIGTNSWHTDGYALDILKILCFFSDVDEKKGTTQFKRHDGHIHVFRAPAGKWILFRNSIIEHCGLPPLPPNENRLTVEITLVPALIADPRPVFAGVNGHFPCFPWGGMRASSATPNTGATIQAG